MKERKTKEGGGGRGGSGRGGSVCNGLFSIGVTGGSSEKLRMEAVKFVFA